MIIVNRGEKRMEQDYLAHHGIKGQKWGIRRWQNVDGSLTEEGIYRYRAIKTNRTKSAVDDIYGKLTGTDKRLLGDDEKSKEYLSTEQGEFVVKRLLDRDGDKPVAFLDIMTTTKRGELAISLATDPDYRGQGRAAKLAKKSTDWFDKNGAKNGFEYLDWSALKENTASQKVAEKAGFTYIKENGDWLIYRYDPRIKLKDLR